MKKRTSKVISFSLVGVKTLKGTEDEKIVEVIDGNTISTLTYNKKDEITKGIQNNDNTNNVLEYFSRARKTTVSAANSLWSSSKHMKVADRYFAIL